MVCPRCIKVVSDEFEKLDLTIKKIELGRVKVASKLSIDKIERIPKVLADNGFELIDDKQSLLINKIKTIIIGKIRYSKSTLEAVNWSDYISKEIGKDYSYLSKLFSDVVKILPLKNTSSIRKLKG